MWHLILYLDTWVTNWLVDRIQIDEAWLQGHTVTLKFIKGIRIRQKIYFCVVKTRLS